MAQVMLRAPLSELCGGRSHAIAGTTVGEVLVALEPEHPLLRADQQLCHRTFSLP